MLLQSLECCGISRGRVLKNTVHTIEFKEEDFEETVATTVDEIRALGKSWLDKI
jgi:hypothetical protein